MGYNDPCDNDHTHHPAVIGIGPPGNVRWVCMACFDEYLARITTHITPPKEPT